MSARYQVLEIGQVVLETDDLDEAMAAAAETNGNLDDESAGDGCASVYDIRTAQWVQS